MKNLLITLALLGVAVALPSAQQFINDNNVLNYALTLENFESTLYSYVTKTYNDAAFTAAGYPSGTWAAINYIGGVEAAHAALLNTTIVTRGWPAVPVCSNYNFTSITNIAQAVSTLAVVEAVGTSAYDGAALGLTDKGLLTVAAGIATVEGRHTSLLNTIINGGAGGTFTPYLNGNDQSTPFNFTYVQSLIAPFFLGANCPSATMNPSYYNNGAAYTVSSTTASSYSWSSANSLRGLPAGGFSYSNVNATVASNDLAILNYALALENLEATFYNQFSYLYSAANITAAFPGVSATNAAIISANIAVIAAHETAHVAFLTNTINTLDNKATPGTACNYNWVNLGLGPTSTFSTFLGVAALLENTGVTAYVGAISYIVNSDVTTQAAAIATVEGEHAAYIANLLNQAKQNGLNNITQVNPNVGDPAPGNGALSFNTPAAIDVAASYIDGATPPTLITQGISQIIPTSSCQLGSPSPTSIPNSPFLFFGDQGNTPAAAATPATTTTTTGNNNNIPIATTTTGPNTNTRNGASAVVVSLALLVAAVLVMI